MNFPAEAPQPGPSIPSVAWRRPALIIAAVALVVSVIGFGWTLGGHFLGDDFGYIARFFEYPLAQWPRLFVGSWAGDIWGFELRELRPVTALSFMVDARLWAANAGGFRATNLLLHAACAAMVGLVAWRAAGRDLLAGVASALLFALHPAHAEPVQWITGRVDVLATGLYLAGFIAFLRHRAAGGRLWVPLIGALYVAAAFAKEFGLTLPLMFLLADVLWLQGWRRWREWRTWAPYVACVVVAVIYFFCRRAAFGGSGMGAGVPAFTDAAFQTQLAQRQLTYLGHLFPPFERWLGEGTPLLKESARRSFYLITAAVVAGFALWRWGARHRPASERSAAVFFGLGWYLVATLPLIVTYISPRHLYLASAGVCIALALILRGVLRHRVVLGAAVLGLAIWYGQRLSLTMKPWHEAAVASGKIARELRALEPEMKPGGALFLDVTEIRDGAYVWTWAVPFALRPPFVRSRLDERQVVLESRGLYVDWDRWHEQPAIGAVRRVETESWIVQLAGDNPVRRIAVPAEKVRAAGERFAVAPLKKFPHQSWRKLIDEMAAP